VRVPPPDDVQGAALAALARQLGHARLFVLDDGDPTAKAMATYVSRAARRAGLMVVGGAHWGRPPTFPMLAQRIRDARADAVVITGCICSDGGRLMVALRRGLGHGVPLLASDNFTFAGDMGSPDAPPEVFGTYISEAGADPATLGARGRGFLRRTFPGRPLTDIDRLVPAAAAAASALLDAIARSDGSRASIVEELTHGRAAATPLGSLSFDANGDVTRYPVSIYRISRDAPPGPHLPVQGLKLDRIIEADPAMSAP